MQRIIEFRGFPIKWNQPYSPHCMARFEKNFLISTECDVIFNGNDGYEVTHGEDQHTVIIEGRSCTYRSWDITGIPCPHAMCLILHAKKDPLNYISGCYEKECFLIVYENAMQPLRGSKFWKIDDYAPIEPPTVKK